MPNNLKPDFISRQVIRGQYAFIDLAPPQERPLSIVCAGHEECSPDFSIQRHGFDYCAVEIIISGEWELRSKEGVYTLRPGAVFAYSPKTVFSIKAVGSKELIKSFVDFAGTEASSKLAISGLVPAVPTYLLQSRWALDIFDQLLNLATLAKPQASTLGPVLVDLLLTRIQIDGMTGSTIDQPARETFLRCRSYIHEHYLKLRDVSSVAQACHVHPAYLSRLFKKYHVESPHRFLTRLKMDHAADMLLRGGVSVKEAAATVGVEDPYHFSKKFKMVYSQAPKHFSAYRKRQESS